MSDEQGFFSRWSARKTQLREGRAPAEPAVAQPVAVVAPPPLPAAAAETQADTPPPTLDDVAQLTRASDYSRFVATDVGDDVRNAALKKLFADPHFNVMDGLDIYIDDYGKPDPLPQHLLRKMANAAFVGLQRDDDDEQPALEAAADNEDADLRLQPDDAAGRSGPEPDAGADAGREP